MRLLISLLTICLLLLVSFDASSNYSGSGREPRDASQSRGGNHNRDIRSNDRISRDSQTGSNKVSDPVMTDKSGTSGSDSSGSDSSGSSSSGSSSSGSGDDDAFARAPIEVERDNNGKERSKGEMLFAGNQTSIDAIRAAGFYVFSVKPLASSDKILARIKVRANSSMEADIAALRNLATQAQVEPNFLFRATGIEVHNAAISSSSTTVTSLASVKSYVGIVDTGVDSTLSAMQGAIGATRNFTAQYTPRPHGSHVAEILATQGAHFDVADVFSLDAQGNPVATAESIARGIDWLVTKNVPVINVSISGPNSSVLSDVVTRAFSKGIVIVAAAGNDGPAAPAVFPAAFNEVVAVTAVDSNGKVYRRANRGAYVDFAAVGVHVQVTDINGRKQDISGTSFAAPLVAAAIASKHQRPSTESMQQVLADMQKHAVDLGQRGRDPIFGWGEVTFKK